MRREKVEYIEITEDVRLPDSKVVLEKGDKIRILNLKEATRFNEFTDLVDNVFFEDYKSLANAMVQALSDSEFHDLYEYIKRMY